MVKIYGRIGAVVASLALVASLSACASDPLAEQYRSGDNKNYIAGDGTVTEFDKANRAEAVDWFGKTTTGETLSSEQLGGVVVVMNFWYAGCAPCRAEVPELIALAKKFESQKVQFVGVNVRDTAATAAAFERNFKLTYPSIVDSDNGSVLLAFTGVVTPQSVPTTLVIGRDGKVTSRVLGRIDSSILDTLIETAATE
jgi:thiol-disulfide isomerase/thioredoxin